jgi:hypothetical protein
MMLKLDWADELLVDASETKDAGVIDEEEGCEPEVEERSSLLEVLRALLVDSCTCISIENAHYCDVLSWMFLEYMFGFENVSLGMFITLYPMTLSLLARNSVITDSSMKEIDPLTSGDFSNVEPLAYLRIVENTERTKFVSLKSLRREDADVLVRRVLGVESVKESLLDTIYKVSLANPIWCTELALFIKTRGVDQFLQRIGNNRDNPLGSLITHRFDNLNTDQKTVLKYASVIGDKFDFVTLLEIIPMHMELGAKMQELRDDGLRMILDQLTQQGFLSAIPASTAQGQSHMFQHELVRDTIYSQWPPSHVAVVHEAVAAHIENRSDDLQLMYPRLCYHYKMSQTNHALSYMYMVKTADQFVSVGAYKEGLMYARSAYEAASTRTELKELYVVVKIALLDINPNLATRLTNTLKGSHPSIDKQTTGFQVLKKDIRLKIEELETVYRRPSVALNWQPTYSHTRAAQVRGMSRFIPKRTTSSDDAEQSKTAHRCNVS